MSNCSIKKCGKPLASCHYCHKAVDPVYCSEHLTDEERKEKKICTKCLAILCPLCLLTEQLKPMVYCSITDNPLYNSYSYCHLTGACHAHSNQSGLCRLCETQTHNPELL